jgi:type IV pilus biogenesis protein CpaD/CtpE
LKDVTGRELVETLRRQQKETMARATAAREATTAEVEKVKKELSMEHEKEIDVVLMSVRKHMREKYKAKVLGLQQAWEEEKQALLFHQHGGSSRRKSTAAAAAAASFSVAAASVSRGGASHVRKALPSR